MYWNSVLWNNTPGEARRAKRFVRYTPARLFTMDGKLLAEGFSLDLSMDGARLEVDRNIPTRTPIQVSFTSRNKSFRMFCTARVVEGREGRCHVRFSGRCKAQLESLARYLVPS